MQTALPNSDHSLLSRPEEIVRFYEDELDKAVKRVGWLRNVISAFRGDGERAAKRTSDGASVALKWRSEVRRCLNGQNVLVTSSDVADCVAVRNTIPVDRNIRLKVSTTLSTLYNEGEIGRYARDGERDYYYGLRNYFENDGTTVKKEHEAVVPK